jgi:hypothetical protein
LPAHSFRTSAKQPGKANNNHPSQNTQGPEISDHARRQIEALIAEKASRSSARRKMDSRLIYGIKQHRGEQIAEGVDALNIDLSLNKRGEVIVDITASVTPQLLKKLKQAGAKILSSFEEYNSVRAEVDIDAIDAISNLPEVKFIQPMQEAITSQDDAPQDFDPEHLRTTRPGFEEREQNITHEIANALDEFQANAYNIGNGGVRKSEADLTHKALLARNTYGFDGTGIKIGILSDGVRNLAAVQASGDLGPVTVLPGQSGTSAGQCAANASCDEGTAMLEIVHDIAPGAQLYFATAFGGSANFANNIRNLRTAGCDIIVDDVFYFAESPFQDGQATGIISPTNGGIVAQAVNDVTAAGALYFSSAGNSGNKNDGTSGVWEGDFVDGGNAIAPLAGAGRLHQFPGGLNYDVVTLTGSSQYNLNWSDPLGGSANDYDLFALNSTGTTVIAASTGNQNGTQDPFEAIGPAPTGSRLVIARFSGVGRYLRLTTNRGRLNVNTPGQTTGHSCSLGAFGVAATPSVGPFPNPFSAANVVETFSSDGPRKLFFQPNGTPFTPGNVSSTGGISRQKPDITAADGVSVTGAGGFGISFFGTSAAAPHAGAIAALVKSANPSLTPTLIRDALQNSAIDIETGGIDRDAGYGIIMADAALQYIGAAPGAANVTLGTVTVSDVGGNTNGFIEPGERATVAIPLLNTGVNPAMNVTATISSATPGVTITPSGTRAYPDIAATSGSSLSATPYEFVLQPAATYATKIDFVLTVNYNGVTRSYPFIVPTGQLAKISTVLDTTAPVSGANYTATTGLQVSRMNFTFPISACGSAKANPGAAVSALNRRYDAYSFTNPSAAPICVTVNLTHSANVLLYVDAYIPTFVPATVASNWAADNGGSATSGAGTTQLFAFNVPAGQTFTVVVSESNSGGAPNVPYNLTVTGLPAAAVPANVAPVNAVPGAQTVLEDNTLVFSAAGSNSISISDADAGNNPVQVAVAATNGLLSLGGTTGLSFSSGDGVGDTTMTFTGSIADINSALNGSSFSGSPNFNGAAALTITTNDQGNTGTGAAQSDSDTVNINVTPVNDAPAFTAGTNQTALEDAAAQTVLGWATSISTGPADEAGQTLNFTVNNDNNALFSAQPAVAPNGTLTYTSAANANGSATVTLVLKDNGGTANGGVDTSAAQTFTINVTPVNDSPAFTAGTNQTALEDAGAQTVANWATSISTGPADEAGQTRNFTVNNNNNALFSAQPAVAPDGTLTYTSAANVNGSAIVTLVLKDNGGTANGGVDTSTGQTFTINVTPVNDAPAFTAGTNQTSLEDAGAQTVANWATSITPGPADEASQTVNFIVNNNNNALFSAQPAVAPNGTLTYTSSANANGSATVSLVLKDNGGTANGGVDTSAPQNFTITVTPVNDPPVANAGPDQTLECAGGAAAVTLNGSASSDQENDTLAYQWREGATVLGTGAILNTSLAFGPHTITLKVSDPSGDFSEDTVSVNIVDTTNPTITPNGQVITLWGPNKKHETITVANLIASAGDSCDTGVNLGSVVISKVTSDEGSLADNDILIAADCKSVQLRPDRNGNGDGRVYTITFTVRDAVGHVQTLTRQVIVPHDQGTSSGAIDSGVAYTVTSSCP